MFAVEVELLGGRYVATAHNDRSRAEWPPHPARFFSALVAALYDRSPADAAEREALTWLERQGAPALDVDLDGVGERDGVGRRDVRDVYVPVNDVTLVGDPETDLRKGMHVVTDARARLQAVPATDSREWKKNEKDLRVAERELEKQRTKLEAFVAEQHIADAAPAAKAIATAEALLPDRRTRHVRSFPVVVPSRPIFAFTWPEAPPVELRAPLEGLVERVTRLGHSSSLVRCAVVARSVAPTLVPDDLGGIVLRVVGPGQLARLDAEYDRHKGVGSRILPSIVQRYRVASPAQPSEVIPACSAFSDADADWLVFSRIGGARPLSSRGVGLARALRAALLEQQGGRPMPSALSGHESDGAATVEPHVAFVPLPYVGPRHADASLQGIAIVLPRAASSDVRTQLFRLVANLEKERGIHPDGTLSLAGRNLPPVEVRRVELFGRWTLRPVTWSRPSMRFVTATPIALDRNPGKLRSHSPTTARAAAEEAQRSIADACVCIGLPRPEHIEVSFAPLLTGAEPVWRHPPYPNVPGRPQRVRVHAMLSFTRPVRGPVILGAGRHFGLGLCLPVGERAFVPEDAHVPSSR